jgi:hypothetical protein
VYPQFEEIKSIRLEFEKLLDRINDAIKRNALEIRNDRVRVIDWSKI